jgi:hypothetical protein
MILGWQRQAQLADGFRYCQRAIGKPFGLAAATRNGEDGDAFAWMCQVSTRDQIALNVWPTGLS